VKKNLIRNLLVAVLVLAGAGYLIAVRGAGTDDASQGEAFALSVPVIVTPSVQVAPGQVILFKATNIAESGNSFRLMIYNDDSGIPVVYKDFLKVGPGKTVSYVYRPPMGTLTLDGDTAIEAPESTRATFAPIPATADPGVIRRVVANVQVLTVQNGANGAQTLDASTSVPLSHCNFEPRSHIPYLGGNWYWNCAPDLYPKKPLPPADQ